MSAKEKLSMIACYLLVACIAIMACYGRRIQEMTL